MSPLGRRDFLALSGVGALTALAGCESYDPADVTYTPWEQHRYGPANRGYNPNASVPTESLRTAWAGTPGAVVSRGDRRYGPVIGDSHVYQIIEDTVFAYRTDDGSLAYSLGLDAPATGEPAASGNRLTVPAGSKLVHIHEETGWGSSGDPYVKWEIDHEGTVRGGITHAEGSFYYQLDTGAVVAAAHDGSKVQWTYDDWPRAGAAGGSPIITEDSVAVPTNRGIGVFRGIHNYDAPTNEDVNETVEFVEPDPESTAAYTPATPLVADGMVAYYATADGRLIAVSLTGVAAEAGGLLWEQSLSVTGAPALYGSTLLVPTESGIDARRTANGERRWDARYQPTEGLSWSAPAVTGGVGYAISSNGDLHAFSTADGSEIARFEAPRALDGRVTISGDQLFALPNDPVAAAAATGESDANETATTSSTDTTQGGEQLFSVSGRAGVDHIESLHADKLALADEIDGLSLPIGIPLDNGTESLIQDRKLAEPLADDILSGAREGSLSPRTARDVLERMRWSEHVTKRTLEWTGPTTDVPQSHVKTVDDIPLGEYLTFDVGKMSFMTLIELALLLGLPAKVAGVVGKAGVKGLGKASPYLDDVARAGDDVAKAGDDVAKAGDDGAKGGDDVAKGDDDVVKAGFNKVDEVSGTAAETLDGFTSYVDEGWNTLTSAYDDLAPALDDIGKWLKGQAMEAASSFIDDAIQTMKLTAVGNDKFLKLLLDSKLAKVVRFIRQGLKSMGRSIAKGGSAAADDGVKFVLEQFRKTARELDKAGETVMRLGGRAKGPTQRTGKRAEGDRAAGEGSDLYRSAKKRTSKRYEQARSVYRNYQRAKEAGNFQAFGNDINVVENLEDVLQSYLQKKVMESNDEPIETTASEASETDGETTESTTPTDTVLSDGLISRAASVIGSGVSFVADLIDWVTRTASFAFGFVYQHVIERGHPAASMAASLPSVDSTSTQHLERGSLKGALTDAKERLSSNFDNLSRTDGLENQTQAREAFDRTTTRLTRHREKIVKPILEFNELNFNEMTEDYPNIRKLMEQVVETFVSLDDRAAEGAAGMIGHFADEVFPEAVAEKIRDGSADPRDILENFGDEQIRRSIGAISRSTHLLTIVNPSFLAVHFALGDESQKEIVIGLLKLLRFVVLAVGGVVTKGTSMFGGQLSIVELQRIHYEGVHGVMQANPSYKITDAF